MVMTWRSFGADNPVSQVYHWGVRDGLLEILAEWYAQSFGADNPIDQTRGWGSLPDEEVEEDDWAEEDDPLEDDDGF